MRKMIIPACVAALSLPFASIAKDEPAPQEQLEQLCIDEGETEEVCGCFGGFVAENFTDTEMAGAVAVFTDPSLADNRDNPPETIAEWFATLAALSDKVEALGISQGEMFSVFFRVIELRETAMELCTAPPAAEASQTEAVTEAEAQ